MTEPNVDGDQKGVGESQEGTPGDKHPETVPWDKYVGIKEKFTRVEGELNAKITGLEEQIKKAVSTEEHDRIKTELEDTKIKLQTASDELKTTKEATLSEKRATLVSKGGISEDDAKAMSEGEINGAIKVLASYKPKPDLGGGGGGESPTGAKSKIQSGFESLHPSK